MSKRKFYGDSRGIQFDASVCRWWLEWVRWAEPGSSHAQEGGSAFYIIAHTLDRQMSGIRLSMWSRVWKVWPHSCCQLQRN